MKPAFPDRAYWHTKGDADANCQDCSWASRWNGGAKGHAARHHDQTGHVVRVEESRAYYYGEDKPGERRWWKSVGETP